MYIAICDDHAADLENLIHLLELWQAEHQIPLHYEVFHNTSELVDAARQKHFTLYLLDIMMSGISGIAAAKEIRSFDTVADIVFLTTTPNFAYESYSVKALEYLLKPINANLLFPILDHHFLKEQNLQEGLTVKIGTALVRIPFSQLTYVEVNNKHLYFNLVGGQVKQTIGSLKDYEDILLSRPEFMRIHRSYIVNMLQLTEFSPSGAITFAGKNLPVSRLLYPQLQKDYVKLLFAQRDS